MTEPIIIATADQLSAAIRGALKAELALTSTDGPKEVLTLKEAAEFLGVNHKTLMRYTHEKSLPVRYISHAEPRFFRSQLVAWITNLPSDPKQLKAG